MENYTYATEFHLQGEKLMKAMHTAKQAELIALQLSLFNGLSSSGTAICVLDLEESQIVNLISSQLRWVNKIFSPFVWIKFAVLLGYQFLFMPTKPFTFLVHSSGYRYYVKGKYI